MLRRYSSVWGAAGVIMQPQGCYGGDSPSLGRHISSSLGRVVYKPPTRSQQHRHSSSSSSSSSGSSSSYSAPSASGTDCLSSDSTVIPIVQFPARSLFGHQQPMPKADMESTQFTAMLKRLKEARAYYKYPSMCAPQIGWNARVFVLSDGTVWVNAEVVETSENTQTNDDEFISTCYAWEPCASHPQFLHYVERPWSCTIRGLDETGNPQQVEYTKNRARHCLHELDHLEGRQFIRKIKNGNYAVPIDSFTAMSEWPDDFPSIEARSTHLHTLYVPKGNKFITDVMPDGDYFYRQMEEDVYPGCDLAKEARKELGAFKEMARSRYREMQQLEEEKKAAAAAPYITQQEEGGGDEDIDFNARFTPVADEDDEDE